MRLRVIGRHDPLLFAGLTFALLVVFQRSIQNGLDVARDVERAYGVALMPALIILTVMFVFHQHAKRREMRAETSAAAKEAEMQRARADELERLMLFGQTLGRALTPDALREAVWRHLPAWSGGADVWVVIRADGAWERLTDHACSRWPAGGIERIAEAVASRSPRDLARPDGIDHEGHLCFVMLAGEQPLGVVAVPLDAAHGGLRQKLGTAAALMAIAVKNMRLFADVRDHSVRDGLTGCFNREHTLDVLQAELGRSRRAQNALSLVLFDVDNFKGVNDRHGHLCGDSVLAAVGRRVRSVLRKSDVRCRYGGDEFLVVLPETDAAGATRVAEWLRNEIEQIVIRANDQRVAVTISAGTATTVAGEMAAAALINRADQALYDAKAHGRNCVRSAADVALSRPLTPLAPAGAMLTH